MRHGVPLQSITIVYNCGQFSVGTLWKVTIVQWNVAKWPLDTINVLVNSSSLIKSYYDG